MTIKAETIAKYYGVNRSSIFNYKKGSVEKQRLYNAMVEYINKNKKVENE